MTYANSFAERAAAVTQYGFPVVPLKPRTKIAFISGWENLATTDETQIAEWNKQNPNFNCAAVAKNDGGWVWDIDNPIVFERLQKDTGHSVDEIVTLIVKSSGEKRHIYFKHDDCSRVMGNRDCSIGGKEAFSVRANNRYVVAAGSVHPDTGKSYEIVSEPLFGSIPVAPPWLTDWIMQQTSRPQAPAAASVEGSIIIPEGGRDNWLFEKACKLRDTGFPQDDVIEILQQQNEKHCQPPMSDSAVQQKVKSAFSRESRVLQNPTERPLKVDDIVDFVKEVLLERKMLLSPFLTERSIGMVHAWRGTGKTHIMFGMAAAEASGGQFLRWKAPEPSPVLYIDGEMADRDNQDWLKETLACEGIPSLERGMFRVIIADRQDYGITSLLTPDGQRWVEDQIKNAKTIYFDNISCLFRGGDEKEGTDWEVAQEWLLSLRRQGIATVLGHHDGKQFTQRGTSKREDPMNWVIHLKHPADYQMEDGLRCEIHFEKARRLHGSDARPFEVSLAVGQDGKPVWVIKEMVKAMAEQAKQMRDDGLSFNEIGKRMGISKSYAEKLAKRPEGSTNPLAVKVNDPAVGNEGLF